jgi:hypothetical protein
VNIFETLFVYQNLRAFEQRRELSELTAALLEEFRTSFSGEMKGILGKLHSGKDRRNILQQHASCKAALESSCTKFTVSNNRIPLLTNTGTILQIIRVEDRKRISTSTDIRIS